MFDEFSDNLRVIEDYLEKNNIEIEYGCNYLLINQPQNISLETFKKSQFVKIIKELNEIINYFGYGLSRGYTFKIIDGDKLSFEMCRSGCTRATVFYERNIKKLYILNKNSEDDRDYNLSKLTENQLNDLRAPNIKRIVDRIELLTKPKPEYKSPFEYISNFINKIFK